ncbi:MAG: hypothetical protein ACOVKV_04785 [Novosphingobium sp.]
MIRRLTWTPAVADRRAEDLYQVVCMGLLGSTLIAVAAIAVMIA